MSSWRWLAAVLIVSAVGLQHEAYGEVICWTTDHTQRIQCAQTDGSGLVTVLQNPGRPMGMAVDQADEKLFWVEQEPNRIMSLDLNGTASPTVLVELGLGVGLRGMAVAASIDKIYWVAEDLQKIQRANFDGSNVEDLPIATGSFFDVQVDDVHGTLYWTNGDEIWRGNLDGTGGVAIIGDTEQPYYVALDVGAGKIYWTDFAAQEIGRANLDGSDREVPAPINGLLSRPIGITLDAETAKIYWTLESGSVQRANLDGTGVETLLTGIEGAWDIAVVESIPSVAAIPAASTWGLIVLALGLLAAGSAVGIRGSITQHGTA